MNISDVLLWGWVASLMVTVVMSSGKRFGLSRMSLPFMLGTMFTSNRNRASFVGFLAHLVLGWLLACIYAWAFESWGRSGIWLGAGIGLVHATTVLVTVMPLLPSIHPRMASEHHGPEPTRQLEPPGFLALNYGRGTAALTVLAHLVYGMILGTFYQLA
jgi:hypothetical protein